MEGWTKKFENSSTIPPFIGKHHRKRASENERERAWKCFCFATSPFEYQIMNPFSTQRPRGAVCKLHFANVEQELLSKPKPASRERETEAKMCLEDGKSHGASIRAF